MQKYFLAIFICLSYTVSGQTADFRIIPGLSAGKVKLGMTEAQVRTVLEGEFEVKNYKQELKEFVSGSSNFHLDSIPQFIIGFDKSLTASSDALEHNPVFNMYFMKDKLVYIGITSYSIADEMKNSVVLKDSIRFGMTLEDCQAVIGLDFMPIIYGTYTGDHVYYKAGFEMTYDEGVLTFVGIFRADPLYPKKLIASRARLKMEQSNAEKSNQ